MPDTYALLRRGFQTAASVPRTRQAGRKVDRRGAAEVDIFAAEQPNGACVTFQDSDPATPDPRATCSHPLER